MSPEFLFAFVAVLMWVGIKVNSTLVRVFTGTVALLLIKSVVEAAP